MRKKLIAIILVLCIMLTLVPMSVLAEDTPTPVLVEEAPSSGSCGDNATWTISGTTLTITGSGNIQNNEVAEGSQSMWPFQIDKITSVVIGNGITSIGDHAFYEFRSLVNVSLPESLTSIGAGAFESCKELTEISIPNKVNKIGNSAFSRCLRLTSISIPYGVKEIEPCTFTSCISLTSVSIPDSVISIGNDAFYACNDLSSVIIPNSVKKIHPNAFGATGLTDVTIPDSVESFENAFARCPDLLNITISKGAGPIEYNSFGECGSLLNIEVHIDNKYNTSVDGVLFTKDKKTLCAYPEGRQGAYVIPSGVGSIGYRAFWGCNGLTSVTIPNSVCFINREAFNDCSSLKNVYYDGSENQWNSIIKSYDFKDATIHYNSGSQTLPVEIISLYPANKSTFNHAATSGDKQFHITFDREVSNAGGNRPSLDFSAGTLTVYRLSDDSIVYQLPESPFTPNTSTSISLWGHSVPFTAVSISDITSKLDYGREYYVTMPAGLIKFADGTGCPAIEKGVWSFKTANKVPDTVIEWSPLMQPKSGNFSFHSDILKGKKDQQGNPDEDIQYGYYYDESWFLNDSTEYQHGLAQMSLKAALAAYGTHGLDNSR